MTHLATITTAWQYANEQGRIHYVVTDGEHERWCHVDPGEALHDLLLPHVRGRVQLPQQSSASQISAGQ